MVRGAPLSFLNGSCPPGSHSWSRSHAKAVFTLNVNYIQLNYYSTYHILHSILFNYGSVHICENSNKLGRVTSQSKVENRMAPYRTAAMIFTAILDLEARRKAKETSKARKRKIRRLRKQQRMRQTTTCPPFCSITHCNYFKQPPLGCLK